MEAYTQSACADQAGLEKQKAASFPGFPLLFAFTIIDRSGRATKNGEGQEAFITRMTSVDPKWTLRVARGPTTNTIICSSTLQQF